MKDARGKSLTIIVVSLAVCVASFLKFNLCRPSAFAGAIATSHACYSDIPIFWISRVLEVHLWPFSSLFIPELSMTINPIEYPVIIGTIIWALSYITPTSGSPDVNYFDVNAIFLSILFMLSAYIVYKINKKNIYMYILAPAVIASLFINWDLWAVVPALLTVFYFDHQKFQKSSLFLAIAISAKFYPIVLLLPISIILIRKGLGLKLAKYLSFTAFFYLTINIYFMIRDWEGWIFFFISNFSRGIGYGSIWEILNIYNIKINNLNLLYGFTSILVFALVSAFYIKRVSLPNLSEVAFFAIFAFTFSSKVYSPQYVLWLTPFAVLAIKNRFQFKSYVVWQFFELAYHVGIWQHLYWIGAGQQNEGLSPTNYAVISSLRLLTLLIFTISLAMGNNQKIVAETRGFEPPKPFRG